MASVRELILELERIREAARSLENRASSLGGAASFAGDGARQAATCLSQLQSEINSEINRLMR